MGFQVEKRFVVLVSKRIGESPVLALADDIAFLVTLVRPIATYRRQFRFALERLGVDHACFVERKPQQVRTRSRSIGKFGGSGKLKADYGPFHEAIMFDGSNTANKG